MKYDRNFDHRNTWTDQEVEQHWDRVASIYIDENNKVKNAHDQRFVQSLEPLQMKSGQRILNITSRDAEANDYLLKALADIEVINAEISQGLMDEAKKVRPYIRQVKLASYSKLPFEDHHFDRILTLETLEHVADPIAFLSELHRVSANDARMVLSCPPKTSEWPYQIFTFLFGGHGEGPHRFLPSKEVKALLQKTGWKLLSHQGTLLIPAGPLFLQNFGEKIIQKFQHTFIAELGIRQFYICEKQ